MMIKWQKGQRHGFLYFLHFFTVFTGIFVIMTVMILHVILKDTYVPIDKALMAATADKTFFVRKSLSLAEVARERGYDIPLQLRLKGQILANTEIIVYDADNQILTNVDMLSGLPYLEVNPDALNTIVQVKVINISGTEEVYRLITMPVDDFIFPEARYLSIAINITQLEETNERHVRIIGSLMFLFWILSIGASLYLAKWSRRPIIESYERQKAFVENASHELRTPLAVLQNRLELLFRKPDTSIMANSENIASSLEEVRNMRVLTTNLLDLARREDGMTVQKQDLAPSFFDAIALNYQLIAEEEGKVFVFDNNLSTPILTDPALIKQVMTILVDNAMKYTDTDGVMVMTIQLLDKRLQISLADNGYGIKDEEKSKIFERFYRVDKARTRQKGGFGLGLSLAKQIVDALGGTIMVYDNQPKGTVFDVRIIL